jgi:cytochrome P450
MVSVADAPRAYSTAEPLGFDISAAGFKADPFPTFAAMRAAGPVIPVRMAFIGRSWVTTTHAATAAVVKRSDLFTLEGRRVGRSGPAGYQWWMPRSLRLVANTMLQKDEPDHRRLRKLVDHAFARRDIQAMRGDIERIADSLLDGLEGRAEVDLAAEFSRRLPIIVICDLLGVPEDDRAEFAEAARKMLSFNSAAGFLLAIGSFQKMIAYVRAQIESARRDPRPGLIAELIRAEADGDKLDENELMSMILLLLVAGSETTTHLISDSVVALEQHPDQKAWLFEDPAERMERAVEELARFSSPVQGTKPRFVAQDTEFFGQRLRRGELIMAMVAAANADPAEFDEPQALRLDRFPNPHLVFSSGVHFCLGQQLARVEAQSAISRLYARFPDLALAPGPIAWIERLGIHAPKTLPVRLNGRAARLAA